MRALCLFMLCSTASLAEAAGINLTVDRQQAAVNEQIRMTLTVEGAQSPNPQLPKLDEFVVHSAGTSRQFQFINGRSTSSVVFNYVLVPKRVGSFAIGAAVVEIDQRLYRSKPFKITVRSAAAGAESGKGDLFVTARLSDDQPFLGQQVIYTLRFYNRLRINRANAEIPTFDGFIAEQVGEQKEYRAVMGGKEFHVTEMKRALFAQELGELTIPATELKVEVIDRTSRRSFFSDPFFGGARTQTKIVRSNALTVKVRPLPAEPARFSGLVGQFKITGQVSKERLKVGESTTLTLTIAGTGNVRAIVEPQLTGLERFKVYADKPVSAVDTAGGVVRGNKTFRQALVPLAQGELVIPSVPLVYFDPESGSYQTSRTMPVAMTVMEADNPEELKLTELVGSGGSKVAVKVIADDIRPVYTDIDALRSQRLDLKSGLVWGGGFAAPPVAYAALLFLRRRRLREAGDASLRRRRTALGRAKKAVTLLRKLEGQKAAVEASRILRTFLGDLLALEGLALTPAEAAARLEAAGVDEALVKEIVGLLQRCERSQFGASSLSDSELAKLPGELSQIIGQLDKRLRKRSAA